jgi:hypothetical protein
MRARDVRLPVPFVFLSKRVSARVAGESFRVSLQHVPGLVLHKSAADFAPRHVAPAAEAAAHFAPRHVVTEAAEAAPVPAPAPAPAAPPLAAAPEPVSPVAPAPLPVAPEPVGAAAPADGEDDDEEAAYMRRLATSLNPEDA